MRLPAKGKANQPASQELLLAKLDRLTEAVQKLEDRVTKVTEAQEASTRKADKEIAVLGAQVCTAIVINVGAYVAPAYVAAAVFSMTVAQFQHK